MSRINQGERFERGDQVQVLQDGIRYWRDGEFVKYYSDGTMVVSVDISPTMSIDRIFRPNQVRRRREGQADRKSVV